MDEDKFKALLEKYYAKNLTHPEALQFIFEYCLERGAQESESKKLIDALPMTPYIFHCLEYALHWYKVKFNITEILKPANNGFVVIKVL